MKSILMLTCIGILFSLAGIYFTYLYLQSIDTTNPLWLLGLAVGSASISIVSFYKATNPKNPKNDSTNADDLSGIEKVLERNNEIANSWNKVISEREKMRMLELSAAAQAQEEKK